MRATCLLPTIMKFLAFVSLACLTGAVPSPLSAFAGSDQLPLGGLEEHAITYPGFNLDLSAQRLVQMEGQEPVWMTELEKVSYALQLASLSS
jgi:leucyl aminopeptidase